MQSYYDNNHEGICIKYNTEKFSTFLKEKLFSHFL